MKILEGSKSFMNDLRSESSRAKKKFYVQAMTFEGDQAGTELVELMVASPAKEKCLVIDSYSKVVVNDHFVFSFRYLFNKTYREEVQNTRRLLKSVKDQGIKVVFTNPVGILMWKYPLRNHKKMVVVDELTYLGGINFSDHNFEWHDMMVKVDSIQLSREIEKDIELTIDGKNQSEIKKIDEDRLYFLNGSRSKGDYNKLFDQLRNAKSQVDVISPYVSDPLLAILLGLDPSIEINIFTPAENNKGLFRENLLATNASGRFNIIELPGMTHMKAILVDQTQFFFGSSNFDLISYYFEQEVVMQCSNSALIEEFNALLARLTKNGTVLKSESSRKPWQLKFVSWFCKIASRTLLQPS